MVDETGNMMSPMNTITCDKTQQGELTGRRRRSNSMSCKVEFRSSPSLLSNITNKPLTPESVDESVLQEGRAILLYHIQEAIEQEGFGDSVYKESSLEYSRNMGKKTGKRLRELADAFARTKERQQVKMEADMICLIDLCYGQFWDLLVSMFESHRNISERIVVLFTFISDVVLRSIVSKIKDLLKNLLGWALQFLSSYVCAWVQEHGGWATTLGIGSIVCTTTFLIGAFVTGLASWTIYKLWHTW